MAATSPPARLLVEAQPRSGAWNMAFDEALLEAAVRRSQIALRIYRWAEPTLSLGYFQKAVPPDFDAPLRALPRVRRLSGGGAILHDQEWTYSCAIPRTHRFAARPEALYDAVHSALVRALAARFVTARPRGTNDRAADTAFLCFLRGDARDLLIAGHKIVGSAQRRRRGAVLQHGSVLLRRSPLAAHVPGVFDLTGEADADSFFAAPEFVAELGPEVFDSEVTAEPAAIDIEFADDREADYALAATSGPVTIL